MKSVLEAFDVSFCWTSTQMSVRVLFVARCSSEGLCLENCVPCSKRSEQSKLSENEPAQSEFAPFMQLSTVSEIAVRTRLKNAV